VFYLNIMIGVELHEQNEHVEQIDMAISSVGTPAENQNTGMPLCNMGKA
jgi:hypothetical protein